MNKKGIILENIIKYILILIVIFIIFISITKITSIAKGSVLSNLNFVNSFLSNSNSPFEKIVFENNNINFDLKNSFNKKIRLITTITTSEGNKKVLGEAIDTKETKKYSYDLKQTLSNIDKEIFSRLDIQVTDDEEKKIYYTKTYFITGFDNLFEDGQKVKEFRTKVKKMFSPKLSYSKEDINKLFYVVSSFFKPLNYGPVDNIYRILESYCDEIPITYLKLNGYSIEKPEGCFELYSKNTCTPGSVSCYSFEKAVNNKVPSIFYSSEYDESYLSYNGCLARNKCIYFRPSTKDIPSDVNYYTVKFNGKTFIFIEKNW